MQKLLISLSLLLSIVLTEFAHANVFDEEDSEEEVKTYDPMEGWNRSMYKFNLFVDKYTMKPIAKTYRKTLPKPVRKSLRNFTENLLEPLDFANSVLQLDFKNSGISLAQFAINSTIGVFGLFDVAGKWGIKAREEDFGQTLAKYKVGAGPYIVLPFLGPSNLRDATGLIVDSVADPIWHIDEEPFNENYFRYSVKALQFIDTREKYLDTLDDIERNSIDPYVFLRSAYTQNRKALIENRK